MYTRSFLDYDTPDRVRIMLETKDGNNIYLLISKHMGIDMNTAKNRYDVDFNHIRQSITIRGGLIDMYYLHKELMRYRVSVESVMEDELRINLNEFINKIV